MQYFGNGLCCKANGGRSGAFAFAIVALILAGMTGTTATAATITVNPGSSIQTGINSAAAGDTVLVRAGTYTGGINLNRSVTLQAEPGVTVNGNNSGQAVNVACSDCAVIGFTFVDFAYGIQADNITGRNRVTLRNNIQRRTNYGFWISGDDWVVENNEVDRIIRRSSGGDADYGRIFGNRHVVRRNWFHGTQIPTDLAPGPDYAHTDCLQYYNQNGEILRDILIEENIFTDFVQGLFIGNETGNGTAVQRVTVRNNVFWGTSFQAAGNLLGSPSWGVYFGKNGPERNIVIENNIFRNCSNSLGILTGTDAIVRRNIVANGGTVYILEGTSPSIVTTTPGGNLLYQNNWTGEMAPSTDTTNVNPQFQNVNALVGADGVPWTTDDGWRPMNTAAQAFGPQVTLGGGGGGGGGGATVDAANDSASVAEDSNAVLINVLNNDTVTPTAALTISTVGTPSAGATVSISGSSISYRPAANFFGTETFSYTAREAGGATDTATVSVTVTGVNDAPNAVNNTYSVAQNSGVTTFSVLSNDTFTPDTGETLTVASVTTPNQGGSATIVSNTIRYTPATGFAGTETFSYTINDGNSGTDSATVTVTVTPTTTPNTAPNARNNTYNNIQEDSTGNTLNVLSNDEDADGDTMTIISRTNPSQGGTVTIDAGALSYSPRANFSGQETFSYTISDGRGGTDSANVTINVVGANDAPNAVDDSYTVDRGSSGNNLAVLANDTDPENNSLSITGLSATSNGGTVSIAGASLTYTPAANFSGTDSFTYTVSDGNGGTDTATVTVTVEGDNTRPTARNDSYTLRRNSSGNVLTVMSNDSDPDNGDEITIAGFDPPNQGGSVSLGNANTLVYSPAADFTGTETFVYRVQDLSGSIDDATVTITVVNQSPTARPDRFRIRRNSTWNRFNVLQNDTSNSGTALSLTGTFQEVREILGTIELDGNDILYTPPTDFVGEEAFLYTIRDENGDTATGEVTVEVAEVFGLDICEDYPAILVQMAALYNDFGLTGSDVDGDTIPDDFMVEAMQIIACFDAESSLGTALQTAYQINLLHFDDEPNAEALATYREALAALMLMNTGMQGALNQTLDVEGLTLTGVYEIVACDANGVCMPQAVPGQSLAEGYQAWDEAVRGMMEEPFAGSSDLDDDGFSNAEEYARVVEAGGSRTDFAAAVTDPELDGSGAVGDGGGGGGGGGCFIATAAYGTPLATQIDVLREVRDAQMLDTSLGAAFVDAYYRLSPPVARLVADYPALAAAVRVALWPLVMLGKSVLLLPTLALAMAFALALMAKVRRKRQTA